MYQVTKSRIYHLNIIGILVIRLVICNNEPIHRWIISTRIKKQLKIVIKLSKIRYDKADFHDEQSSNSMVKLVDCLSQMWKFGTKHKIEFIRCLKFLCLFYLWHSKTILFLASPASFFNPLLQHLI